ncbi:hypothetical protein Y71_11665 [Kosakonia radicincitans DSM 16656]|uniref:HEPN domain-containing protein n=1 Tax=Kosakonia radicincitans TaxID=283686 RepID=A0AAX2ERS1_9ENTR|nr:MULTISPECIES: hypothetical protein [Kosakonia]MDP9567539.1 hypothetical protein [Kosakonia oryzae]APG18362.1 hypothetical protein A3780_12650 [Kosakonia radicincitans]ARD60549.1 hypothetical protein Y71_11665 [Kosakonia radicincitans DSM 16656]KDE34932.1 hypothetical protein AW40_18830 [Kosakonia radicincitans UMEnt01/12]MDD7995607.1 hypothetical protein [Kosakonia radicincitans]
MASETRNFINSIIKNFKEAIGLINVLILEPEEPDTLRLLHFKLDVIKAGIEQDIRLLSRASLDSNAMLCLYPIHNALNALNYCLGILKHMPINNQFYHDFEEVKHAVNALDAISGRVFTNPGSDE